MELCDIWPDLADIVRGYSGTEASKQVRSKLRYFSAIRSGLKRNKDKIPELPLEIAEINDILLNYDKKIAL